VTLHARQQQAISFRGRSLLAFVLTPIAAFANDPDEIEAVAELLGAAKSEAIERWRSLQSESLLQ